MDIAISGGGIAGLLLALSLKHRLGHKSTVYEQAPAYCTKSSFLCNDPAEQVGGAIGLYANGLRVINDIDPSILSSIRQQGVTYNKRRWVRHDGTTIAVADEKVQYTPSFSC